ncbi:hypothetical protein AQ764_14195 [Burkholderia pseudomallei]|uniref:hypothetical protein n=1 Tax=Burkholderia pseudomallei TaxID=28450 RepID=UPI0009D27483|nr:hypothetical protein [Burkholderia pseudomallei]OMT68725.1 hypothetical protein AQ764_14195 [Burkholderia pseudomallei]
MATTKIRLCEAVLTGSAASVYGPVPAGAVVTPQAASAWNPASASAPVAVDVFIVPTGGSATDATHVGHVSVAVGRTALLVELLNHTLNTGDQLYAVGNGCTLTVSGNMISN